MDISLQWVPSAPTGASGSLFAAPGGDSASPGRAIAAIDDQHVASLVSSIADAASEFERTTAHDRRDTLLRWADRLATDRARLARAMAEEVGKPIRDGLAEVDRAAQAIRWAAAECERFGVEAVRTDVALAQRRSLGLARRRPLSVGLAILPFNYPVGSLAVKLAPAIAVGCAMIVRPSPLAPRSTTIALQAIGDSTLLHGAVRAVACSHAAAMRMVSDDRIRFLTFTGSRAVGQLLARGAGAKASTFELGGCTVAIVDETADLDESAAHIAESAFRFAGQTCTSCQAVLAHETVADALLARLRSAAGAIVAGDPSSPETQIGPVISDDAARRFDALVASARSSGGRVVLGGGRHGRHCAPTIIADVAASHSLFGEEAFLPIVALRPVATLEVAIARVNASPLALQSLLYTQRMQSVFDAWGALDSGSVIVNGRSGRRFDHLPFGGRKGSGHGREGILETMRAMTEASTLLLDGFDDQSISRQTRFGAQPQ